MPISRELIQNDTLLRMILENENLSPLAIELIQIQIKLNEIAMEKEKAEN